MIYLESLLWALPITVLALVMLRPLALQIGLVDHPKGRKRHGRIVPVIGGIGMFIGILAGTWLLPGAHPEFMWMLLGCTVLVFVGILDDRFAIPYHPRLIAQLGVVLLMYFGGGLSIIQVGDVIGTGVVNLGPLALAMTALVTLTVINAFNFIDGVDGLAGSLALVTMVAIAVVTATMGGDPAVLVTAAIFSGALLGFLGFNFPVGKWRARLFMGDAGSMMVGFVIVWLTITITQGERAIVSPVAGLWFALLPISDLFTCFMIRIKRGKSPFHPGHEHFHYTLRRGGFSDRGILFVLVGLSAFYAAVGLLGIYFAIPDWLMFWGWIFICFTQHFPMRRLAIMRRLVVFKRKGVFERRASVR